LIGSARFDLTQRGHRLASEHFRALFVIRASLEAELQSKARQAQYSLVHSEKSPPRPPMLDGLFSFVQHPLKAAGHRASFHE
jgi:hypothetical protein